MAKKLIDQVRDAAFSMEIGRGEETGTAALMLSTPEGLLIVKERAIYKVIHADEVDPSRSNINLPNTHQRILAVGLDSEVVGRTLLTADSLIKTGFMPSHIQCDSAKGVVLQILVELIALQEIIEDWKKHKAEAEQEIKLDSDDALKIPSIHDLSPKFKSAVQRGDHVMQMILDLAKIFFPSWDLSRNPFDSFVKKVREEFPEGLFGDLAADIALLRQAFRTLRECIEHPRLGQTISIENYKLLADGNICTPTFTVEHPRLKQTQDLMIYWEAMFSDLLALVELTIVYLCGAVARFDSLPICVVPLDENQRRTKNVGFAYAVATSQGVMVFG